MQIPGPYIKNTKMEYKRQHGISYTYHGDYTYKNAKEVIENFFNILKEDKLGGYFKANILLADENGNLIKWFSLTKMMDLNKDRNVVWSFKKDGVISDSNESLLENKPEKIVKGIQIIYFPETEAKGGCGPHNDCLYDCLMRHAPNITKRIFPKPSSLKRFCGLSRDDKIPVTYIKDIENKMPQCKIVVTGDYEYNSDKTGKCIINIKLKDSHYSPGNVTNIFRIKGIAFEEKKPILFKGGENVNQVLLYDGVKEYTISYEKFKKHYNKCITSKYIFIKSLTPDIKSEYQEFIKTADFLKKATNGTYNLYKTGNIMKTALYRFCTLNCGLAVEELSPDEAKWILNSMSGGIIWYAKDYKGPAHEYDINSAYPYIYSHSLFTFPIKRGEFRHYTQSEFDNLKYLPHGIFRCIIEGIDRRLFRVNFEHYYTYHDLKRAQELGYKIKLIEDGLPNALLYPASCCINGNKVFSLYVKELIELKTKYPEYKSYFKYLLNFIWGSLCAKNKNKQILNSDVPSKIEGDIILDLLPYYKDEKYYIVKSVTYDDIFMTPFARIGPFILSKMRYILSRLIEPHLEHIVRIHTDGFYATQEIRFEKTSNAMHSLKLGQNIGDIKHIEHKYIEIINGHCIVK